MSSRQHVLRQPLMPNDDSWKFTDIPAQFLAPGPPNDRFLGKIISFTSEAIILRRQRLTVNRVLAGDDPVMFISASFEGLRSVEFTGKVTAEYLIRLFKEGLWLNGQQYRFYHHSNSQLVRSPAYTFFAKITYCGQRGRSCYLRRANNDQELDRRIYDMGDYGKIMNVAKSKAPPYQ
jgi:hypothetical protein